MLYCASVDFTPVTGFSQRLPLMNLRPPEKVFTVNLQLLEQPRQVMAFTLWVNSSSASLLKSVESSVALPAACAFSWAYSAAPYAPIRPAMVGRMTSWPISCSNARSTASFRNVPPCTTISRPIALESTARITLYSAFLTTLMERPAEMFSTVAPSFCACFTEEFMNTVQREPRSTGRSANRPSFAKSSME